MTLKLELADSLEKLATLGDVEHIAAFLQDSSVLAHPNSDLRGPVALYLRQSLDTPWTSANADSVVVAREGEVSELPLPPVVQEFTAAFNNHRFVELEANDARPKSDLQRRLLEAIAWLERSDGPGDIATYFQTAGISGTPNVTTDCALVSYLRARLEAEAILVGRRGVAVYRARQTVGTVLPRNLSRFVHEFDQGEFSTLVQPNHEQEVGRRAIALTTRQRLLRMFRR